MFLPQTFILSTSLCFESNVLLIIDVLTVKYLTSWVSFTQHYTLKQLIYLELSKDLKIYTYF